MLSRRILRRGRADRPPPHSPFLSSSPSFIPPLLSLPFIFPSSSPPSHASSMHPHLCPSLLVLPALLTTSPLLFCFLPFISLSSSFPPLTSPHPHLHPPLFLQPSAFYHYLPSPPSLPIPFFPLHLSLTLSPPQLSPS